MADGSGFFQELKRRHVWRVLIAYVVTAWVALQLASIVLPTFGTPSWVLKALIAVIVILFPIALILAWAFEITPEGVRRTEPATSSDARTTGDTRAMGRKLNTGIIVALVIAVVLLAGNQFIWHKGMGTAKVAAPAAATAAQTPAAAAKVAATTPGAAHAATAAVAMAAPVPAATAAIPEKSVAVLPFANEGAKSEQFFSDGLSEDLITALSQFDGLKVISRNSAFQFRNSKDPSARIGQLLGVAHLLEGSVQRAGDEVRITATLVNASDGSILWSHRYDQPYKDLFKLQDAITKAVSDALKAKLLTASGVVVQNDRPPSGNITAYSSYLRARADALRGPESDLRRAIAEYGEAIRLDPAYAAAYAARGLARARLLAIYLPDGSHRSLQEDASADIAKALALDADSALAYRARAYVLLNLSIDPVGAERAVRHALRLAPNNPDAMAMLGQVLASTGHVQQAVSVTRHAIKTDPLSAIPYYWLSSYLAGLGHLDEAKQAVQTAIGLQPDGYGNYEELAIIEMLRGDAKAALAAARQEQPGPWRNDAMLLALQVGTDRAAADAALNHALATFAPGSRYQIAQAYALRHDPDDMFQWLDRARAVDDAGIPYLLYDPLILRYRDDPRFAAFTKKVGLPTTTDAVAIKP